jgi:serine/threonine-protein kinase
VGFDASLPNRQTLVGMPESLGEDEGVHDDELLPPGAEIVQSKRFEIVEPLGEGGMGRIYRAYDPSMDRYVALKVLKPDVPEAEARRFQREAHIAANFSHPNLVRVLEVGNQGQLRWLAMEYLRGRDIGDAIATRKALSFRVLVDVFSQTLEALEYIHLRKIAHCDIKPENIFITRDAYDRRLVVVKLIDFGIARNFDGPLELQTYVSGDPRYMPPEQGRLNFPIDHRVDLYALGMTFYESFCRRHPFENFLDMHPADLLQVHAEVQAPPPSHWLPTGTPPRLAAGFDQFFAKACAKDREQRHDSAREMKEELVALLELLE